MYTGKILFIKRFFTSQLQISYTGFHVFQFSRGEEPNRSAIHPSHFNPGNNQYPHALLHPRPPLVEFWICSPWLFTYFKLDQLSLPTSNLITLLILLCALLPYFAVNVYSQKRLPSLKGTVVHF